jgi:hypothetical protein
MGMSYLHLQGIHLLCHNNEDFTDLQQVVLKWTMTKKEEALLIFERKIHRRMFGPKYENGE